MVYRVIPSYIGKRVLKSRTGWLTQISNFWLLFKIRSMIIHFNRIREDSCWINYAWCITSHSRVVFYLYHCVRCTFAIYSQLYSYIQRRFLWLKRQSWVCTDDMILPWFIYISDTWSYRGQRVPLAALTGINLSYPGTEQLMLEINVSPCTALCMY